CFPTRRSSDLGYDTAAQSSLVGDGIAIGRSFYLVLKHDGDTLCGGLYFSHQYQFLPLGTGTANFKPISVAQGQSSLARDSPTSWTLCSFECLGDGAVSRIGL